MLNLVIAYACCSFVLHKSNLMREICLGRAPGSKTNFSLGLYARNGHIRSLLNKYYMRVRYNGHMSCASTLLFILVINDHPAHPPPHHQ